MGHRVVVLGLRPLGLSLIPEGIGIRPQDRVNPHLHDALRLSELRESDAHFREKMVGWTRHLLAITSHGAQ